MTSFFQKLFGRSKDRTEILAERLLRHLIPSNVGEIQRALGLPSSRGGLRREEIYNFCKLYPDKAELMIKEWFEVHKSVKR